MRLFLCLYIQGLLMFEIISEEQFELPMTDWYVYRTSPLGQQFSIHFHVILVKSFFQQEHFLI